MVISRGVTAPLAWICPKSATCLRVLEGEGLLVSTGRAASWCRRSCEIPGLQYLAVFLLARRSHRDAAICFRRINSTTARRGEGYESARSPHWQPGSRKSWGTPESPRVVMLVHYPLQSAGHANNSKVDLYSPITGEGEIPKTRCSPLVLKIIDQLPHPSAVGRAANDEKFDETEDEVEVDGL